jgi:hypothetical protein
VTLVPQQKNGYDCGLFVCRYAYAIFKIRDNFFNQLDISGSELLLRDEIINNEHFRFNQEVINQFRIQLKQLLQNLSDVYRYGTLKKARQSKSQKLGILRKPRQSKTQKNRQSTAAEKKNKSSKKRNGKQLQHQLQLIDANNYIAATRSDDAAVDDDQRIALTISDDAAVDDEQMHNNDANKYIALTRKDDEHLHNNDGTNYVVHHNRVDDEAAVDKVTANDDELSQEYFMSNEFEVQSAEEEVLLEREHKERECNSMSDDLDSDAPIASLATKISTNAMKSIFDTSKAVHPPIVGKIVKKKCVAWAKQRQIASTTRRS